MNEKNPGCATIVVVMLVNLVIWGVGIALTVWIASTVWRWANG